MKKYLISLFVSLALIVPTFSLSQIAINTDGTSADASAMLDITATDKGMLIPRMSSTDRDAIASPANGLMIYNTTNNSFEYFNGSSWSSVGGSSGGLTVTSNIDMDGNYLSGDGDDEGIFVDSLGNVGIGTNMPTEDAALEIASTSKALLLSRMTTAQRNSLKATVGMILYNIDTKTLQVCNDIISGVDQEATGKGRVDSIDNVSTNKYNAFGQSFTSSTQGTLTDIEISIQGVSTSGNFVLTVFEGEGYTGSVIATENITITSAGDLTIPLTAQPNIQSSTVYTFRIADANYPGAAATNVSFYFQTSTHPDGLFYFSSGGTDNSTTGFALTFKVFTEGVSWADLH